MSTAAKEAERAAIAAQTHEFLNRGGRISQHAMDDTHARRASKGFKRAKGKEVVVRYASKEEARAGTLRAFGSINNNGERK